MTYDFCSLVEHLFIMQPNRVFVPGGLTKRLVPICLYFIQNHISAAKLEYSESLIIPSNNS